jgi:uncharacterized protein
MSKHGRKYGRRARGVGPWMTRGLVSLIQLYRHMVSPLRLPTCRFTPTCSQYAVDALTEYGLMHGGWLAAVRLVKCGPWHRGGWDPIPERRVRSAPISHVWDTPAKLRERDFLV